MGDTNTYKISTTSCYSGIPQSASCKDSYFISINLISYERNCDICNTTDCNLSNNGSCERFSFQGSSMNWEYYYFYSVISGVSGTAAYSTKWIECRNTTGTRLFTNFFIFNNTCVKGKILEVRNMIYIWINYLPTKIALSSLRFQILGFSF